MKLIYYFFNTINTIFRRFYFRQPTSLTAYVGLGLGFGFIQYIQRNWLAIISIHRVHLKSS